jgi:hypothetical protein
MEVHAVLDDRAAAHLPKIRAFCPGRVNDPCSHKWGLVSALQLIGDRTEGGAEVSKAEKFVAPARVPHDELTFAANNGPVIQFIKTCVTSTVMVGKVRHPLSASGWTLLIGEAGAPMLGGGSG